jgi:hypothetical protein
MSLLIVRSSKYLLWLIVIKDKSPYVSVLVRSSTFNSIYRNIIARKLCPHTQKHKSFLISKILIYLIALRRMPIKPINPDPNNQNAPGIGTG